MTLPDLSPAEKDTLEALARFREREKRAPTVREVMAERGKRSIDGTFTALRQLAAFGMITSSYELTEFGRAGAKEPPRRFPFGRPGSPDSRRS